MADLTLPDEFGKRVLALWRMTESSNPNHQALHAWMTEWLERCQAENWRL